MVQTDFTPRIGRVVVGDIIFSSGNSIISKAIRWWTVSEWSHVAVAISKDSFVEATYPKVRVGLVEELYGGKFVVLTPKVPLTFGEAERLVSYLLSKVGKRYDWRGLLSFVLRKNVHNKSYYFCSELVAEAYDHIGRPLLRRSPSWVTPQDLYQSLELVEGVL